MPKHPKRSPGRKLSPQTGTLPSRLPPRRINVDRLPGLPRIAGRDQSFPGSIRIWISIPPAIRSLRRLTKVLIRHLPVGQPAGSRHQITRGGAFYKRPVNDIACTPAGACLERSRTGGIEPEIGCVGFGGSGHIRSALRSGQARAFVRLERQSARALRRQLFCRGITPACVTITGWATAVAGPTRARVCWTPRRPYSC